MIYIHIPFCRSFCTYCGFYSEILADNALTQSCSRDYEALGTASFAEALCEEIRHRSGEILAARQRGGRTLYFGGGTPSVLEIEDFRKIVACLGQVLAAEPIGAEEVVEVGALGVETEPPTSLFSEFTVEVNPDDVVSKGVEYVKALRALGVNRISMGVQAMDERVLRWMNRRHGVQQAKAAYSIIREAGIENISVDLIFGYSLKFDLPDDNLEDQYEASVLEHFKRQVSSLLAIGGEGSLPCHISAYQLSVDPESALAEKVDRGTYVELPEELCAKEYEQLCRMLKKAGYHHYEISNFARPGFEARHNSAYWSGQAYVGLGPGAHSFDGDFLRTWNDSSLERYVNAAKNNCWQTIVEGETLTREQRLEEVIMLSLRTSMGINPGYLCENPRSVETVKDFVSRGLLIPVETPDDWANSPSRDTESHKETETLAASFKIASDSEDSAPQDMNRKCHPNLRIPEDKFFISDSIISSLLPSF